MRDRCRDLRYENRDRRFMISKNDANMSQRGSKLRIKVLCKQKNITYIRSVLG